MIIYFPLHMRSWDCYAWLDARGLDGYLYTVSPLCAYDDPQWYAVISII